MRGQISIKYAISPHVVYAYNYALSTFSVKSQAKEKKTLVLQVLKKKSIQWLYSFSEECLHFYGCMQLNLYMEVKE